ncbi:hypothetical protein BJ875DRAFT_181429 [Amylocarpus encephaloides]|uniref:Uncharacterized protein n=1 Tax=Amylocarpus encephaloides TaxID=45428 RepID=A0A9P8C217_9HELO|nr:hypothetical protein BJ875DRAFT_181429 [Amylocarpus encephaloides]
MVSSNLTHMDCEELLSRHDNSHGNRCLFAALHAVSPPRRLPPLPLSQKQAINFKLPNFPCRVYCDGLITSARFSSDPRSTTQQEAPGGTPVLFEPLAPSPRFHLEVSSPLKQGGSYPRYVKTTYFENHTIAIASPVAGGGPRELGMGRWAPSVSPRRPWCRRGLDAREGNATSSSVCTTDFVSLAAVRGRRSGGRALYLCCRRRSSLQAPWRVSPSRCSATPWCQDPFWPPSTVPSVDVALAPNPLGVQRWLDDHGSSTTGLGIASWEGSARGEGVASLSPRTLLEVLVSILSS